MRQVCPAAPACGNVQAHRVIPHAHALALTSASSTAATRDAQSMCALLMSAASSTAKASLLNGVASAGMGRRSTKDTYVCVCVCVCA